MSMIHQIIKEHYPQPTPKPVHVQPETTSAPKPPVDHPIHWSKERIIELCKSRLGVAVITACIVVAILCVCKPVYVCQKNEQGQQTNILNFYSAIFFGIIGGVIVYVIPGVLR